MDYNTLGNSNIKISPLTLGTWAFASDGVWGDQNEKDSYNTVMTAIDKGINFIDTSEMYGNGSSEEVLGRVLKGHRNRVVISTKVASKNLGKNDLIKACENSLKRLQTDYIDLYQIHWPNDKISMEETVRAMEKLVSDGKVRALGVCNFGIKNIETISSLSNIQVNQLPYSLLWRAIEYDIKSSCEKNNVGVLAYSPLSQGLLTGKYSNVQEVPSGRMGTRYYNRRHLPNSRHGEEGMETEVFNVISKIRDISNNLSQPMTKVAMAWLIKQEGINSIIFGARNPKQLDEIIGALDLTLSQEIISDLTSVTDKLKQKVGNNPDMWEGKAKSRFI